MIKKTRKSGFSIDDVTTFIKRIFYENPRVEIKLREIVNIATHNTFCDRGVVKSILNELLRSKFIEKGEGGFIYNGDSDNLLDGTVVGVSRGAVFVSVNPEEDDIMVATHNSCHALFGDKIKIMLYPQRREKREGVITQIVERSKKRYAGVITITNYGGYVELDNCNIFVDPFVSEENLLGAKSGDKVAVIIDDWKEGSSTPVAHVVRVYGKSGENSAEMHAILDEYDLPYEFRAEIETAANKIKDNITKTEIKKRRDFREITTFTIDPVDAKDFDDALSIRKSANGGWEIGVHIADVTHYIKEDSVLDKEALERATSVYLVDRVVPMLPERLSNGICSLRPDEEKCCFSAVFEMDESAQITSEWFGRTVIKSNRRFTYEEAQNIIETKEGDYKEEVLKLDELAKVLRSERFKKGAIGFDRDEPKFKLDENGKPLEVYFKVMKDSNHLVEEFMLLANKKVAEFIGKSKTAKARKTFVYRIHDKPNSEKFDVFSKFAAKFGYVVDSHNDKNIGKEINKVLGAIKNKKEEGMLSILALRSMAKAKYSTANIGHYGLAFPYYTHFTSPIRRYPDMMVHRLLQHYLDGGKSANETLYEEMCDHSSKREILATEAERASIKYKMAEYLSDKIDVEFKGSISGISEWGIYVELEESKIEGMVPVKTIGDDFYLFDSENYRMVGEKTRKTLNLGDLVKVKVARTDLRQKQIDYKLISKIDFNSGKEELFTSTSPKKDGGRKDSKRKGHDKGKERSRDKGRGKGRSKRK